MSSNKLFEESFAPNAHDNSDTSSQASLENCEHPVKRYVTRFANAEAIARNLKAENVKQVKNQIKKNESEQVRYLSLDNATKDVEILELKEKLETLTKIVKAIENFEELMKKFEKNASIYKSLIAEINIKDYRELMNNEVQRIEIIPSPVLDIPELTHTVSALNNSYNMKKKLEETTREKFHDSIFWKATTSKRQIFRCIECVIGILLFLFFLYNFFHN